MCHLLISDFGSRILDLQIRNPYSAIRNSPLNLLYLDFRISLAVALFALVLFAAFLFENNDLFAAAMADYSSLDGSSADLVASDQSFDVDLIALFALDRRHPDRLALGHRKLFSA
jgi:hypothetical protein